MVIEEFDRKFEKQLRKDIGSTAEGVGAATARRVLRNHFPKPGPNVRLARDVKELRRYVRPSSAILDDAYSSNQQVFVEGTQGTGLSMMHGDYPFTTSRDTTVSACLSEAGIAPCRLRRSVMVCRTYPIRVMNPEGRTSGPMGREISYDAIAERSGIAIDELKKTELSSVTKKPRRIAEFSWHLLRRASTLNGPTDIALSFADYVSAKNKDARRFDQLTAETIEFIEEVERVAGAPVTLISTRFHTRSIIDRRKW
jgi:adenylosuccinate synthase